MGADPKVSIDAAIYLADLDKNADWFMNLLSVFSRLWAGEDRFLDLVR